MTVCVHEHEPACVWAYGALRLADVWKKGKTRDGDAGVEKEKSGGGGEELYSEELVEQKEAPLKWEIIGFS